MSAEIRLVSGVAPKTLTYFLIKRKQKMKSRKSEYDKKFIRKTIRFTGDEYNEIQKKLDYIQVNFTTFSRNAILKHEIVLPITLEMIHQVNKIGNNMNQIARAINSHEKLHVLAKLIDIEKQLEELQNGC